MVDSESHEGDAQPKPSMPLEHEDIGEVRDRSVVGYDPAVADLRGSPVQASNKACPSISSSLTSRSRPAAQYEWLRNAWTARRSMRDRSSSSSYPLWTRCLMDRGSSS